jgi:hypothetical protein
MKRRIKMKTLCAAVLFASMAVAQSVPVVALKPQDVEKVRSTRQAMLDAEKAWTDLQTEITNRYLIVDKDDPDASNEKWYPLEQTSGSGTITWSTAGTTATILTTSQLSQDECDDSVLVQLRLEVNLAKVSDAFSGTTDTAVDYYPITQCRTANSR